MLFSLRIERVLTWSSGVDPLTPDDIAEVIVFAAGRRENVVLADSLIFPNHQVKTLISILCVVFLPRQETLGFHLPRVHANHSRLLQPLCIGDHKFPVLTGS